MKDSQHVQPVLAAQQQVEQDQVEVALGQRIGSLLSRLAGGRRNTRCAQRGDEHVLRREIVVDD